MPKMWFIIHTTCSPTRQEDFLWESLKGSAPKGAPSGSPIMFPWDLKEIILVFVTDPSDFNAPKVIFYALMVLYARKVAVGFEMFSRYFCSQGPQGSFECSPNAPKGAIYENRPVSGRVVCIFFICSTTSIHARFTHWLLEEYTCDIKCLWFSDVQSKKWNEFTEASKRSAPLA